MKIFVLLSLALCAAPAFAQPKGGARIIPVQLAEQDQNLRPAETDLQIKEDLQSLANNLKSNNVFASQNSIYNARFGFFGASEWMRYYLEMLNDRTVNVDEVKFLQRDGDAIKAAVVYSFSPSLDDTQASEFWKGARQEILDFKLNASIYDADRQTWKIVPPTAPPDPITTEGKDTLWANIAYYLAQKQNYAPPKTPAERSMNNLKTLGLGVAQLVQDYNEVYAFEPRYLIEALTPYAHDITAFQVPDTNEIYTFNSNLSGKNLAAINEVTKTVLFYEGQNETPTFRYDGKAAICFADGHVALVSPDEAKSLIWKP